MPGVGETRGLEDINKFSGPSRATKYWQGKQGTQPGHVKTAVPYITNRLTGMTGGRDARTDATGIRGIDFTTPGVGQKFAADNMGIFSRPGVSEGYFASTGDYFKGPSAGIKNVRANMGGFYEDSASEGNYGDAQNTLRNSARNTQDFYRDSQRFIRGTSPVESEFDYFRPGLRDKSYSEQMYESGAGGLIDPYQRVQDKQTRNIRNAAAARGEFNTGASMRLEQELGADIAAKEAQDRIALGRSADEMRLARTGEARQFAGDTETAMLGRKNFGLLGARSSDESTRGNVGLLTDAAKAASDAKINRLFQGGKLGLEADAEMRQLFDTGSQIADRSQRSGEDRVVKGAGVSERSERLALDGKREKVKALADAAGISIDADNLTIAETNAILRNSQAGDEEWRTDAKFNLDTEAGLDTEARNRAQFGQDAGFRTQEAAESRLTGGHDRIFAAATEKIRTILGATDKATSERYQAQLADIQAGIDSGAYSQAEGQKMIDDLFASAQLAAKAYEAKNGTRTPAVE